MMLLLAAKINSWHLKGAKEEKRFPYLRDMLCQPEAQANTGNIKVNVSGFGNFQPLRGRWTGEGGGGVLDWGVWGLRGCRRAGSSWRARSGSGVRGSGVSQRDGLRRVRAALAAARPRPLPPLL